MTVAVLLDATVLGDAGGRRGVGTFVRGLLGALVQHPDVAPRALVSPGTTLPVGVQPIVVPRRAPARFRHHERDLRLPWEMRRHAADVHHGLDTEPPPRPPAPYVQTLFDVIPLVVEDPALARLRRRWQRRIGARFRHADRVIAISQHAARGGIEQLGLDPAKVEVALLGVDRAFHPDGPADPRAEAGPYVLVVGEHSRRKGLAEAVAVADLLADAGLPHRLVVAGGIAPWHAPALDALVAGARHPDRVELAGFVDDLPAVYRGAAATVVTSRHEGFGFPALEAMASGTPVVAFDNSSLPEVIGDAGVLVEDGDVEAFARELADVLRAPGRAAELSVAGRERALRFGWDACAAVHADVYRSLS